MGGLQAAQGQWQNLKELVTEASHALATLDADRLEELAKSCEALSRELPAPESPERAELRRQAKEAAPEMNVLAHVLEATRGNMEVMERLRELRMNRLEYGEQLKRRWPGPEGMYGND